MGRTLDFSYPIHPEIFVMPADFAWKSALDTRKFRSRYRFIAIGQQEDDLFGFFDGVNEKGFAAAALYFTGCAHYDAYPESGEKLPVASVEFLRFLLGECGSVEELKSSLSQYTVVGFPDPVTQTAAPLHWMATDRSGACVVVEPTAQGLRLFDNPIGVLANSPEFGWHETNLRNYMGVSPDAALSADWGNVRLTPFGQASGTGLLPGGYTSPERFVRTAYQKTHVLPPENADEAVVTCFHIMDSVTIPIGSVRTDRGTYDYTQYTAFINTDTCAYFFRAYEGSAIETAGLDGRESYAGIPLCLGALTRQPVFERR